MYICRRIPRVLLYMFRKYSFLCLIIICFLLIIYSFKKHFEKCSITYVSYNTNTNNTDIYSYFKYKSSNSSSSSKISLHDVLLVIRTSKNTQAMRIPPILNTWYKFSPSTIHITTNGDPYFLYRSILKEYHHQIHSTKCKQAHTIPDLCCHSASEFNIYFQYKTKYKWLCRFDDDQYVNVPLLIDYLKEFYPDKQALYIGKPSFKEPKRGRRISFWFATYGGGVCFSRYLLNLIYNDIQPNHKFMEGCVASNYPDDTHIAYLLRIKHNINLTIAKNFHHHIEGDLFTNLTTPLTIDQAITFGFKGNNVPRFLPIIKDDVYRMQTLHCLLYPDRNCMQLLRILLNTLYQEKYG